MYCSHCGKEVEEKAVFCSHCGEKVKEEQVNTIVVDSQSRSKSARHICAGIFAITHGVYGVDHFICGKTSKGVKMAVWTTIVQIVGTVLAYFYVGLLLFCVYFTIVLIRSIIRGVNILKMTPDEFDQYLLKN